MRVGDRVQSQKVPCLLAKCRFCSKIVKIPMSECFSKEQIESIFTKVNVKLICENITHPCKVSKPVGNVGICEVISFYHDDPPIQVDEKHEEMKVTRKVDRYGKEI